MRSNKRAFVFFAVIIFLIIILVNIFNVKKIAYTISYNNNKFNVIEKHDSNKYYFEIKSKNKLYPFVVNIKNGRKLIDKIYYYKDSNYECILPIINDRVYNDMMCFYDNILYDYTYLKGDNLDLDNYVSTIKEYDYKKFQDNLVDYKKIGDVSFYNLNINNNVYISTYKGLICKDRNVNLFKKDVYSNDISLFLNKNYITANYNEQYEFNEFYVINLENCKLNKLKSKNSISFDTYIQGIVDDLIYLYDENNEIQYLVDISKKTVKEISSNEKIKYYENGNWKSINKPNINRKVYFKLGDLNTYYSNFDKVIKTDYYYYLIKKDNTTYKLYRAELNSKDILKFISEINTQDIFCEDDYIFYKNGEYLMYYSDYTGKKTVLKDSELKFNDSIKYYVY